MDPIFECGSCALPYDDSAHKPLSLPCGHVFCYDCLSKQMKQLTCPIDKTKFDISCSSLPCCYAILANIPKKSQKEGCCLRHPKKKVKFMCKSHDKFLCTNCVIDHTGAGHNIIAFTVNPAVIKSDIKSLESICESALTTCEEKRKEIDCKSRSAKEFFQSQVEKINISYETCLKTLQAKKKEMISNLNKSISEQMKLLDKSKDSISKIMESSYKVLNKIKSLNNSLPHYESLCQILKNLKQEAKLPEFPSELPSFTFVAFKNSEPLVVFAAGFEEIDQAEVEKRLKACGSKTVLQGNFVNNEVSKTFVAKAEKSGIENKSPDRAERSKCRQNYHARNHPKRMPWRKRTRSY